MKLNYKTWIGMLLLAGTLFAGAPAAFSQVSIGIQIGAPPPAQVVAERPRSPYPEDNVYVWVEGYWYPSEGHYAGTPSDTTAPVTSLTSPTSGATISETASLAASASDNVGVTKVEFYANGSLKGTDTTPPYSYSLDTTTFTKASHSLTTKAYDAAGNVGTSAAVSMTVSNAAPTTNATYYVDQTAGNDANNGTSPTTAWKNAPGMAEYTGSGTLKPGDTVYFDRGDTWLVNGARGLWLIGGVTYIGDTWGTGTRATIRSAVSNDAGVVSFRDDATKLTIFQGFEVDANHTISSGIDLGHRYPILLTGATKRINNVVVHGVSSNASAGQYKYGIIMSSWPLSGTCSYTTGGSGAAGNVANVEVLNSKVYDISRTGIALYPGPCDGLEGIKNITVRGNEVYNTGTDAGTTGYGILTKGNVQDAYIEYNYVHDTSLAGLGVVTNEANGGVLSNYGFGPSNIHFRYNIIKTVDVYGGIRLSDSNTGLKLGGSGDPKDVKIYGNIFFSSTNGHGFLIDSDFANNSNSVILDNNTFYGANISVNNTTAGFTKLEVKNNIVYGYAGSGSALNGSSRFTSSGNNVTTDPSFKNSANLPTGFTGSYPNLVPNTDGLSLLSGSNCINTGATLAAPYNGSINSLTRPQGNAFDVGAYESSGGVTADTTPPSPPTGITVIVF